MTEFIDSARREIQDRLGQLRDEVKRLERAAAALGDGAARRGPGRPPGSGRTTTTRRRRGGRRRGSGTRAAQAEKLVRENPGITISGLGRRMNVQPTYLYRVPPQRQQAGAARKRG